MLAIIEKLRVARPEGLYVTASTGAAADRISGRTLHSFAGIGFGTESVEELLRMVRKSKGATARWKKVQTLIIDEISLVSGILWEKLELLSRTIRKCDSRFGGIQLICCGDFLQLRPFEGQFAFESARWGRCFDAVMVLQKVHRQQEDPQFIGY
jgi:ATP-dependent DNA helicase PIF1